MTRLIAPIFLLVVAALTGCGESSRVTGSGSTVPVVTLMSISVGPPDATVALGISTQFSATATYSDGSKTDVSSSVSWASSAPTVATISDAIGSAGMATPVATGTTTITATLGSVKGSTTLTVSGATLVSIAVTPAASSVAAGTQTQFTATGTYSDESTKNITTSVTWTSSMANVATISNTAGSQGLAQSVGAGSTTITATLNSISGSTTLTVTADTLLSIAITPATPSIANGLTQQFVATGTYTNGTTQTTQPITTTVTWTSSNSAIATISNAAGHQGLATSVSLGTVTITATLGTISSTATLTVTAATLVSVAVTPATPSIAKGRPQQFVATGTYTDHTTQVLTTTAVWVSSAPTVATISNAAGFDGLALGVGVGTTTISATVNGIAGSTTLTVTPATLVSIGVTPTNANVAVGYFVQFTATGIYSDNSTENLTTSVTWTSSTTAATISNAAPAQGRASGLNAGPTVITAALNGVSGTTNLNVTAASLVSITVTPAAPSIANGSTETFIATGTFSDNSQENLTAYVTWTSGTPAVATISNATPTQGVATAVTPGTSTITAAVGSVSGTTTLTVTNATLQSITVTPTTASIALGTTLQFTATGHYSNATTQDITTAATWSSSSAGAPVSNAAGSKGLATGMSPGTATITATFGGTSGTATLTVTSAALVSIAVTPANAVISVGTTQQYTAIGTYTDGTTQPVTTSAAWSSSASTTVAAISSAPTTAGLATAIGAGTTQIVATVGTIASPSVTLTVKPATYAYVTNTTNASISQYIVGLDGVLMPLAAPTITGGGLRYPYAVTVDPANHYAYVADYQADCIYQFKIGTDGGLVQIPLAPACVATSSAGGPNSVNLDPAGNYLYVANNNNGTVDQFSITGGALTLVNTVTVGGAPVTVAFGPSGKYAYVSNSTAPTNPQGNMVSQFSVQANGNLVPLNPTGILAGTQPEGIAIDPSGTYAFVADTAADTVSQFIIGTNGTLTANGTDTPPTPPEVTGSQMVDVALDLTGSYAYATGQNSETVSQYKVVGGKLVPLTPNFLPTYGHAQSVTVDPTNHFVYVTNRGGTVEIFTIGADGSLTPTSPASVPAKPGSTSLATTH